MREIPALTRGMLTLVVIASLWTNSARAAPPTKLEFRDQERIVLVGGTLIEREPQTGFLEARLTARFPHKKLVFRNLGWSGDTVWADSRGIFDSPAVGYSRMVEQIKRLRPTVLILGYGSNEAWSGGAGLSAFVAQFERLVKDVSQPDTRIVVISPLRQEISRLPAPARTVALDRYHKDLLLYQQVLRKLAESRGWHYLDVDGSLFDAARERVAMSLSATDKNSRPLTDNGVHLTAWGAWRFAEIFEQQLLGERGTSSSNASPQAGGNGKRGEGVWLDVDFKTSEIRRAPEQTAWVRVPGGRGIRVTLSIVPERFSISDSPAISGRNLGGRENLATGTKVILRTGKPSISSGLATKPVLREAARRKIRATFPSEKRMRLLIEGWTVALESRETWASGVDVTIPFDDQPWQKLLREIRRKNELHFHSWRPQNVTYLFGFRKHEQGVNAKDVPELERLVEAADAEIHKLCQPQARTFVWEAAKGESR